MRWSAIVCGTQLFLIGFLSWVGQIHWPAKSDVNLAIVGMLTPIGLIKHLVFLKNSPLYVHYFEIEKSMPLTPSQVLLLQALIFIGGIYFFNVRGRS